MNSASILRLDPENQRDLASSSNFSDILYNIQLSSDPFIANSALYNSGQKLKGVLKFFKIFSKIPKHKK
jgi:hypothetical protein